MSEALSLTAPLPEHADELLAQAVFRIKQSKEAAEAGPRDLILLQVEFPSLLAETRLSLRVPKSK